MKKQVKIKNIKIISRDFFLVFCLVFSFYAISSLQSSWIVGGICLCCTLVNRKKTKDLLVLMGNKYCFPLLLFPLIIITNCLVFSTLHGSSDLSYAYSIIALIIKLFCVFFIAEIIYDKNKPISYYETIIVYIFAIQSLIQLAAFMNTSLANKLLYFNHAYDFHAGTEDSIRGLALSGGTAWPLGLSYGLSFIFYTKIYILGKKMNLFTVLIGLLLILGVFFSGRSAYFGIIVSCLYFLCSTRKTVYSKLKIFIRLILLLLIGIATFCLVFPNVVTLLVDRVFPWAFEFFFQQSESGKLETLSTNRLLEMWEERKKITPYIFFVGEGFFTDPITGAYFHRVDVGYLRNIFYWGILGTSVIYLYQISVFNYIFLSRDKEQKLFVFWILFYLFILELKAMTVGFTHFTMVICVLYALLYYKTSRQ